MSTCVPHCSSTGRHIRQAWLVLQCCSAAGCTCLQQDHSLWRPQDTHCVALLSSYSFIVLHWSRKKT